MIYPIKYVLLNLGMDFLQKFMHSGHTVVILLPVADEGNSDGVQ